MKIIALAGQSAQGNHLIVSMTQEEWRTLAAAQGINTGYRSGYEDEKKIGSTLNPSLILKAIRKIDEFKAFVAKLEDSGKSLLELVALINSHKVF